MVCEEVENRLHVQMRRFDTLLPSLSDNRGDAVMASIAVTPEARKLADFQRSVLPHARPLRGAPRHRPQRRAARAARGQEVGGGRWHRARGHSSRRCSRRWTSGPFETPERTPRGVAEGRGRPVVRRRHLAGLLAQRHRLAELLAFRGGPFIESRYFGEGVGIAVKRGNDTLRQAFKLGAVSGCGKRAASAICGCGISRSVLFDCVSGAIDATGGGSYERAVRKNIMSVGEPAASLRELAEQSSAWPFEEARKIVARLKKQPKDEVIFETGYGPSGLPHIGTFGEVARTTMVRQRLPGADRRQDQDAADRLLRRHGWAPQGARQRAEQGDADPASRQALTKVPDPFGTHPSFGEHNNARLRAFLDTFGFEYEFMSSTECYKSGIFDATLLKVLERFDSVMNIMLPSLREERAQTYSPFLPIDPKTGIVLQVPVLSMTPSAARSPTRSRRRRSASPSRSPAGAASCNGSRLGDALGRARASTTRWPARI